MRPGSDQPGHGGDAKYGQPYARAGQRVKVVPSSQGRGAVDQSADRGPRREMNGAVPPGQALDTRLRARRKQPQSLTPQHGLQGCQTCDELGLASPSATHRLPTPIPSAVDPHTVEQARCRASRWSAPLYERLGRPVPCLLGSAWVDGRRDGSPHLHTPPAGTRARAPPIPESSAPAGGIVLGRTRVPPRPPVGSSPINPSRQARGRRPGWSGRRQERRPGRRARAAGALMR